MLHVKLSSSYDLNGSLRQTPQRLGVWDNVQFVTDNDSAGPFDCWIVFDDLARESQAFVRGGNVVFVTWEPPIVRGYNQRFLDQFSAVLTFRDDINHRNRIRSNPLLCWWIGTQGGHSGQVVLRDYDSFKSSVFSEKQLVVSCVCSDKAISEDHRRRLAFVAPKRAAGRTTASLRPGLSAMAGQMA